MNDEPTRPAVRIVSCPRCAAPVEWSARSPYRPFCSERCKMIDLGAWASERYRVADDRSAASDDSVDDASSPESPSRPS